MPLHPTESVASLRPTLAAAAARLCGRLALAVVLLTLAASAATFRYRETLTIEWGTVTFSDAGASVTQDMWFTRQMPTFATDTQFTEGQRSCLRAGFELRRGTVGGQSVWRLDPSLTSDLQSKVRPTECEGLSIQGVGSVPADWSPGDAKTISWPLVVRGEITAPSVDDHLPPTLEVALLLDEVPAGTAWEIPIAQALEQPDVQRYAALSPAERETVRQSASWARVFLVSPATLAGGFPRTIEAKLEFGAQAVPVAFAVRALAEAAPILGANRSFTDAAYDRLFDRLSPERPNAFPGAYRWFPELPVSQRELRNLETHTGTSPGDLLQISVPTPGQPFQAARVLPAVNEWALRIGPFRRVETAAARVSKVHGKTKDYTLADLRAELADKPDDLARYLANVAALERNLALALDALIASPAGRDMQRAGYFWVPSLQAFNAAALRALERERFTRGFTVAFEQNRIIYDTTLAPASASGKVGASFNPEQRLGLDATIAAAGLLRPDDELSLAATVAERILVGALSFRIPYDRSTDGRTSYQVEFLGNAGRDEHFRLGSVSPEVFDHRSQFGGVEHEIKHTAEKWSVSLRNAVLWDAHELIQAGAFGSNHDGGLTLRHRQAWSTAFPQANAGRLWEITVEPQVSFSPRLGWDKSFWRGELAARTRLSWGGNAGEPQPKYLGIGGAFGTSTSDVPAPLLHRLGDTDRMFGLEPGEFSGRTFVHGAAVYGVRLSHLLRGLFKKDGKPDPAEIPPALQGLFAQATAEFGRVSPRSRSLASYALALETAGTPQTGGAGLRVGYAWSPQSLRSSGRMFTALNWSF